MGELHQIQKTEVTFATLYPANIVAMKLCQLRQLFLGQSLRYPQFADAFAEQLPWVWDKHLLIIET